jgi:CRP/FNR family cyclic AMP-dependent transcriptional regulator
LHDRPADRRGGDNAPVTGPLPFLRQLAPSDAEALTSAVRHRRFAAGQVILHAGAAGDDVGLILSGQVRLTTPGAGGREVIIAQRGAGELMGEMAALGGHRRSASAVALEPAEVGLMSASAFKAFLAEHPDAWGVLTRMLIARLAEADRDRIELATRDSVGRVARRLLELAAESSSERSETPRLSVSQDELARWTGATRETVSRALGLMRQLGWVSTEHRTIAILNPQALQERCSG